ncbi:MAG TPA: outer membrane beta-barrel protein [Planctomycetota bacterium]
MRIPTLRILSLGPLALATLALPACSVVQAPTSLVQVNYIFASQVDVDIAGRPNRDDDTTGYWVSYEFLKMRENANLAISYIDRDDDLQGKPAQRIDTQALRLQLRSHHGQEGGLTWYLGPGIGYVLDATDTTGNSYDSTLFYDLELGVRIHLSEGFGLGATADYASIGLDGGKGTRNVDLSGFTASIGAFVDF